LAKKAYRDTGIRVRPEDVAQEAGIRYVARAGDLGNLLHLAELRGQAAVHADDLVVDDGAAREAVKGVAKLLPHLDGEAAAALVVEAVNSVNPRALVIAPQQEKVLGVFDFVREQEAYDLQGLLAAVDVVSQEQVVRLLRMHWRKYRKN